MEIPPPTKGRLPLPAPEPTDIKIVTLRGQRVVLDFHLAALYDVETRVFNQAFKRNSWRFPEPWAFQITPEEMQWLKAQSIIASETWGGRRKMPWAFTEHGVVMAASILTSERAITIMQHVVNVFVQTRKAEVTGSGQISASYGGAISQRLQATIEKLMDAIVDQEKQRTVRDEANDVLKKSLSHLKSKLDKAGFENEELAASAAKMLSEAEANKATAAKTKAETDEIVLRTLTKKLKLVLETERAIARGEIDGFLKILDDLSAK